MSQAELSRKTGAPRSDISKYEAGQAAPQPPRLAVLARVLGVPAASLLEAPGDGESLAQVRAAAGLTQAGLASRAGIGLKRYELAETGRRPLSETDIARFAAAVGMPAQRVRAAHGRDVARARVRNAAAANGAADSGPPEPGTPAGSGIRG